MYENNGIYGGSKMVYGNTNTCVFNIPEGYVPSKIEPNGDITGVRRIRDSDVTSWLQVRNPYAKLTFVRLPEFTDRMQHACPDLGVATFLLLTEYIYSTHVYYVYCSHCGKLYYCYKEGDNLNG